jgi:cytosine/adenosine deaminase-related metal-dependent hydrolase
MEDLEWLGPDVWYAHGVCFTPEEMDVLARTGTGIAHCPTSNMRLASGIPPIPEMLRRGVPVGLAVDGSASNDSSNMLAEVRQAMLLARVGFGPGAMRAENALRLATTGSAALLGRGSELGSLEIGKAADVILVDVSGIDRAGALADHSPPWYYRETARAHQHREWRDRVRDGKPCESMKPRSHATRMHDRSRCCVERGMTFHSALPLGWHRTVHAQLRDQDPAA